MRYDNEIDNVIWNEIVKKDKNSTIYNFYEWGKLLERIHNQDFICLKKGNSIFPLSLVKSKIFGNRLISMPFADYGGPSTEKFDEKELEKIIITAKKVADKLDVDFVEIRSPYEPTISLFEKNGYIKRDDYVTFKINLERKENELWLDIDTERRTAIRKAEENKLLFHNVKKICELKDFYKLYLSRMKGLGSPPQPYKYFETLWKKFFPNNIQICFVCTEDGEKIATALFFKYVYTIHYIYGSSSITHWDLRPNDFLFWNIIKQGVEEKYRILDLGRTRVGSGVYLFKKKWGGQKVKMPYLYYFRKKELKERQEIEYERFSNLWSKYMPTPLTKYLGPWIIKQIG